MYRGQAGDGGRRAPRGSLLRSDPHHDRVPGIHQRTPGAPHPPQGGRRGDAGRGLPVKLDERRHQAVGVPQGRMSRLGVSPCDIYVHDDRAAGLALLVLKGLAGRLRLCIRHTCGDDFILSPLDVTPVQLLLRVLVLLL